MIIRFDDRKLERMAIDHEYDAGFGREVARAYRRVIQFIRDARDERDLYGWKGLHFEKLKGDRRNQRSMRINKQFRLIVHFEPRGAVNLLVVEAIEDYH